MITFTPKLFKHTSSCVIPATPVRPDGDAPALFAVDVAGVQAFAQINRISFGVKRSKSSAPFKNTNKPAIPENQKTYLAPHETTDEDLVKIVEKNPHLEELDLRETNVYNLEPLRQLKDLKKLDISFAPVTDLSPVGALSRLEELVFCSTPVQDLTFLEKLTGLRKLHFALLDDVDLSPLRKLKFLESLFIDGLWVDDLTLFQNMLYLQRLWLPTKLLDFSVLDKLTQLQSLWRRSPSRRIPSQLQDKLLIKQARDLKASSK